MLSSAPPLAFDCRACKRLLRGFNTVDPHNCFNRTTCTRGYFTPVIQWPNPEVSEIKESFELKFLGVLFLGSYVCLSLSTCSGSSTRTIGTLSPAAPHELGSTISNKVVSSVPTLPGSMCELIFPCASTPALERYPFHLGSTLWFRKHATTHCQRACNMATSSFDRFEL